MNDEQVVEALKAIAHPVRFRILRALGSMEKNVGEIDDAADIGQPTLSQQLAVLRNAGLVTTRKDAKLVFYRIEEERFAKACAILGSLGGNLPETSQSARRPTPGVANFARLG